MIKADFLFKFLLLKSIRIRKKKCFALYSFPNNLIPKVITTKGQFSVIKMKGRVLI